MSQWSQGRPSPPEAQGLGPRPLLSLPHSPPPRPCPTTRPHFRAPRSGPTRNTHAHQTFATWDSKAQPLLTLGSEVCLPLAGGGGPAPPHLWCTPWALQPGLGSQGPGAAGRQGSSPPCPSCFWVGTLTHQRFRLREDRSHGRLSPLVCPEKGQVPCSSVGPTATRPSAEKPWLRRVSGPGRPAAPMVTPGVR